MQKPATPPSLDDRPVKPTPRTAGILVVTALVALAAGISLYLELKIRAMAAEIARLEAAAPKFPAAAGASSAQAMKPAGQSGSVPDTASVARRGWAWVPDTATVEKEWRQAVAASGYDRAEFREAINQLRVRLRFHELYRILGLSPAEIAVFEKEAAAKNLTFNELVSPDPAAHEAHKRSQEQAMTRIVANTLGRDYVEPFQAFLVTSDLRGLTSELAAVSLGAGAPLDPAQAEALLQASLAFRQSGDDTPRITTDQVDWEGVSARAQGFLSPAQQQLFRALVDRQKFHQTFKDITGLPVHRPIRKVRSP